MAGLIPVADLRTREEMIASARAARERMGVSVSRFPVATGFSQPDAEIEADPLEAPKSRRLEVNELPAEFAEMLFSRRVLPFTSVAPPPEIKITIRQVIRIVEAVSRFSAIDLCSDRRQSKLALARHCAFWLAKNVTLGSLTQIGTAMGGKDHTTVLHGVRRIDGLLGDTAKEIASLPIGEAAKRVWVELAPQ